MHKLTIPLLCCLITISAATTTSHACTSFFLETPGGPYFATNLDLTIGDGLIFINRRGIAKEGYQKNTLGETKNWVSKYGSVTFNLVGRELPWGGMNEAGLVMSIMQLNASRCPAPDERPPFSEGYLLQLVLDSCANVQEAIQVVSTVRLTEHECKSHYLVADESGESAAFEFLDGEFVYYTGETLPVKAMANAPYAAGVVYMEEGVVPADNPGASVERVAAAARKIESFQPGAGISPIKYSLDVLANVVAAPKKWWSNLFDEPYTRWNVVFDIARREIHFQTQNYPRVRRLSLHNFNFSCDEPLLMLDVNEKLEGPVDQSFQPYDHSINLKSFRTTCGKLGIDVSDQNSAALVELFESFGCAH